MSNALVHADQFEGIIGMVINSLHAHNSRRVYARALQTFIEWFVAHEHTFDKATVDAYVQHLLHGHYASSSINLHLTAIKRLAEEAALNGLLEDRIAQGIARVKAIPKRGTRIGNWLDEKQAAALLRAPNINTPKGHRDRVLLGLLMECGLRRDEASRLDIEQVTQRQGRIILADVLGKGNRVRTIPVPPRLGVLILGWIDRINVNPTTIEKQSATRLFRRNVNPTTIEKQSATTRLLRRIGWTGVIQPEGISVVAIRKIVARYAKSALGMPDLAPHDLRRTFGKLCHQRKAPLDQISVALGHASLRTTQVYLGIGIDLENPACDVLDNLESRSDEDE